MIQRLTNSIQVSGSYSIDWKPEYLPSGIYFYRLQAGKYYEIKKMIYLR